MIHSLSRSSGSKTHFFIVDSWHILASKISENLRISWHPLDQNRAQNHRACRSGPMAAVPGSTRSLEMVVKPAK